MGFRGIKMFKGKIYYSKKQNVYLSDDKLICDFCKKPVEHNCRFYTFQLSKQLVEKIVCYDCHTTKKILKVLKELRRMSNVFSPFTVFLRSEIPDDAKIVLTKGFATVSRGQETVYTVADRGDGSKIDDKTRLAGRESIENAQIGRPQENKKLLEEKDGEEERENNSDTVENIFDD